MRYNLGTRPLIRLTWTDAATQALVDDAATTAVFTKPDGTTGGTATITHSGLGTYLAALPADADQAGAWRYVADAPTLNMRVDGAFVVTADNADLPWAPQLAEVGARIPLRTVELGSLTGTPTGTFTPLTMPDDVQTDLLIDGSVAYVAASAGTVDATLWGLATEAAALRAAAGVELAQAAEQFDQRRYDQLTAAADAALTRLVDRNTAISGTSPTAGAALLPVGSFPEPVAYGDWNL